MPSHVHEIGFHVHEKQSHVNEIAFFFAEKQSHVREIAFRVRGIGGCAHSFMMIINTFSYHIKKI
jgi:hypothetical protein